MSILVIVSIISSLFDLFCEMIQYIEHWIMDIMAVHSTEFIYVNQFRETAVRRRLIQYEIAIKTKVWEIRPQLLEITKTPELRGWIDEMNVNQLIIHNIYILGYETIDERRLTIRYVATDADGKNVDEIETIE